jgi:hypothetical protein
MNNGLAHPQPCFAESDFRNAKAIMEDYIVKLVREYGRYPLQLPESHA